MSGRLRSRLLTIGRAAGTRSESGGIRFFSLAMATFALASSLAAAIAAVAVETARADRIAGGQMVEATDSTPAAQTTVVSFEFDNLREGRQFTVLYLSPGGEDAPMPPGLDAWPEPGTAVLSPELLREGETEDIAGRYGAFAGSIDPAGLADATELLVYVRPAQEFAAEEVSGALTVSAFGGAGPAIPFRNVHWILADQDFTFANTLTLLAVALGVVPSLLLALVASGVASHSRDRRDALITALGGRVPHRLWVALGEAWVPVALGALGAIGFIAWFIADDRRLPAADYVIAAADVRGLWWALGLSAAAAAGWVLSAAVVQSAVGRFKMVGNRPLRKAGKASRALGAALFPIFVAFAALSDVLFNLGFGRAFIGFIGLLGAVLTMPIAISVAVSALGRGMARWGRRGKRPALLTSGARMAFRPDAIARQVFGVCASIFFLLFALTMYGNFADTAAEAADFIDEYGYTLVEVHPRLPADAGEVLNFETSLPQGIETVAYVQSTASGASGSDITQIHMTGTCDALHSLDLPCPDAGRAEQVQATDGALAAWLEWTAFSEETELTVTSGSPPSAVGDDPIALLTFKKDGGEVGAGDLNEANTAFRFGASTSIPGESWATGAAPPSEQAGWMTLIGGFGLVILIFATGLGLTGEFLRFGRSIAPLTVLAGNRKIFWRAAALVSLLPLAAAVLGGFVFGYLVMRPMIVTGVNLITPTFIATTCAAALVAGLVMWIWSATAAVNATENWRPGRGDD
jgi:hypothetical protein